MSWKFFAFGSAFFAALTAIFGKVGVSEINSNLASFIRTVIIVGVTALIVTVRNEWQTPESISVRSGTFLVLSALATGFSWLCYYKALQMAPASQVAPIDKLSILLVILFAVVFLGEALTWKVGVGGVLIGIGVILISF